MVAAREKHVDVEVKTARMLVGLVLLPAVTPITGYFVTRRLAHSINGLASA